MRRTLGFLLTPRRRRFGRQPGAALAELVELVRQSAHARSAVVDQQYTVTAIMVERTIAGGQSQCLLTELLHDDQAEPGRQWTAIAYDEINDRLAGPIHGASARQAINDIPWTTLDPTRVAAATDSPRRS